MQCPQLVRVDLAGATQLEMDPDFETHPRGVRLLQLFRRAPAYLLAAWRQPGQEDNQALSHSLDAILTRLLTGDKSGLWEMRRSETCP
jgi:hypothetical protein